MFVKKIFSFNLLKNFLVQFLKIYTENLKGNSFGKVLKILFKNCFLKKILKNLLKKLFFRKIKKNMLKKLFFW